MGKGSTRRPSHVSAKKYAKNWDKVFKKAKLPEQQELFAEYTKGYWEIREVK